MEKVVLNRNFEDYKRVTDAFKKFIYALTWESRNVCGGEEESVINGLIDKYCSTYGEKEIQKSLENMISFVISQNTRYEICMEDMDKHTKKVINTDNLGLGLKNAADFYHETKNPRVSVFDNKKRCYLTKW